MFLLNGTDDVRGNLPQPVVVQVTHVNMLHCWINKRRTAGRIGEHQSIAP